MAQKRKLSEICDFFGFEERNQENVMAVLDYTQPWPVYFQSLTSLQEDGSGVMAEYLSEGES